MAAPAQALDNNDKLISNVLSPSGATQKLNSGASSTASTVFDANNTTVVRVVSDADCNFAIGTAPVATTSTAYLPGKSGEQIRIAAGHKIAVIGTATLYITVYE